MDSSHKLYLQRAQNELNLAAIILRVSDDREMQVSAFSVKEDTYYSAVISHAYYSIFYAAKAYLLTKGIKTKPPEEHRKTFEAFLRLAEKGVIDMDLVRIYKEILIRADILLHIFEWEKEKRGKFTYKRLPQANRSPAVESIENAKAFFRHTYNICINLS